MLHFHYTAMIPFLAPQTGPVFEQSSAIAISICENYKACTCSHIQKCPDVPFAAPSWGYMLHFPPPCLSHVLRRSVCCRLDRTMSQMLLETGILKSPKCSLGEKRRSPRCSREGNRKGEKKDTSGRAAFAWYPFKTSTSQNKYTDVLSLGTRQESQQPPSCSGAAGRALLHSLPSPAPRSLLSGVHHPFLQCPALGQTDDGALLVYGMTERD